MKNNKEGFATIGLAVAVMLIASLLMITFSNPILNTSRDVKNIEDNTDKYVKAISSNERLESKLKDNVSFRGELNYEDLNTVYNISTVDEKFESESVSFSSGSGSFNIENETDINVSLNVSPIDEEESYSYSFSIVNNGKEIVKEQSLSSGTSVKIGKNFTYNIDKDETNYGEYIINVRTNNCSVSSNVKFDRQVLRELEVKERDSSKIAVIESELIGKNNIISLYYK